MFQNFPNTTHRLAARGILDNFEISLAVLLPNTTTSHAITYTNPSVPKTLKITVLLSLNKGSFIKYW